MAEQAKILAQAAAEFLAAEAKQLRGRPTHAVAPGPSAGAGEAPNVFGQPIPRGYPIPAL
ncbi:MAG TPA: hypothetical protein VJS38_11140 [Phenylobacterium sp.]|uniref:hypothetical protein n=1 Tax=Phenylobacterium sp. TaxID=1871053 RepID=UPI002B48478E|nr:hypothetical protein [Phenylobacterium sp.]HKR88717.1 hypothetical protein [Phenylobacterium sp.]